MPKKITLMADGRLEHVWISAVHGDFIPETAIDVDDAIFLQLSQNPQTKKYDPATQTISDYVQPFVFADALAEKRAEIDSKSSEALTSITSKYTREERDTWEIQKLEAEAWTADNQSPTPFIDSLVANRPSKTKPAMCARILEKSALYIDQSGAVIGKKQAFVDQLYALQAQQDDPNQPDITQVDIDAIVVSY